MWEILEHRRLDKSLKGVSTKVLKRYEKWKDVVRISGPQGPRLIKGFHDEGLKGERSGSRSSRLGIKYRVIYQIANNKVQVLVIDVTAHDQRKN